VLLYMKKIIYLISLVLLVSVAHAITVEKSVSSGVIDSGDTLEVSITVVNDGEDFQGYLYDTIYPLASAEGISVEGGWLPVRGYFMVDIPAGTEETFTYDLVFGDVSGVWDDTYITLGSATLEDEGVVASSNEVEVLISLSNVVCNWNGSCDSGENSDNCYVDCPLGGDDGFCDDYADGVCDPDCSDDCDCDDTCPEEPEGPFSARVSVLINFKEWILGTKTLSELLSSI